MNFQITLTPMLLLGYLTGQFLFFCLRYITLYIKRRPDPTVKTRFLWDKPTFFPKDLGWWLFATFMIFLAITGIRQTYFS